MRYVTTIILNICIIHIGAQSLDDLCKQEPFKISGGVSTNHSYFMTTDSTSQRDPYNYTVTGNLNASIIGISLPLSFSYSNNNTTYQQPFNQLKFIPKYKWVRLHMGYSSMSFSPYSLNGEQFSGVGIELTPGNFNFMTFYGNLRKAVDYDPDDENNFPSYKRVGYGVKTDFTIKGVTSGLSIFKAKDDVNSIYNRIPEDKTVIPKENMVITANTSFPLFSIANISLEYATTAYTDNINDSKKDDVDNVVFKNLGGVFNNRSSTTYFQAYKSSVNLNLSFLNLGANYEMVEPGYKTLGSDYSNNDFENITLDMSTSIINNSVTLAINVGRQRNSLDGKKSRANERIVTSVNVGIRPVKNFNINMAYSNFTSFTKVKSVLDEEENSTNLSYVDTLGFTQISENANLSLSYNYAYKKGISHNFAFNSAVQLASEKQNRRTAENAGTTFYSGLFLYTYKNTPKSLSVNTSFNYNNNEAGEFTSSTMGPNITVSKSFFKKKLKTSLGSAYNLSYNNSELVNKSLSVRLNCGYILMKKHNFSLSSTLISRETITSEITKKKSDITFNFNYSYSF